MRTKLVPLWLIGSRDGGVAYNFMQDLAGRLANRVQLTTDGHRAYLEAVEAAFGADIDFAQLVKIYGAAQNVGPERKYSPENSAARMSASSPAILTRSRSAPAL